MIHESSTTHCYIVRSNVYKVLKRYPSSLTFLSIEHIFLELPDLSGIMTWWALTPHQWSISDCCVLACQDNPHLSRTAADVDRFVACTPVPSDTRCPPGGAGWWVQLALTAGTLQRRHLCGPVWELLAPAGLRVPPVSSQFTGVRRVWCGLCACECWGPAYRLRGLSSDSSPPSPCLSQTWSWPCPECTCEVEAGRT